MGVGQSARPRTVGTATPIFCIFRFPGLFFRYFLKFIEIMFFSFNFYSPYPKYGVLVIRPAPPPPSLPPSSPLRPLSCHTQVCHIQVCHTQICHTKVCRAQICHTYISLRASCSPNASQQSIWASQGGAAEGGCTVVRGVKSKRNCRFSLGRD